MARTHTLAPDSPAVYPAAGVHSNAFTSHHCDLSRRTEEEEEAERHASVSVCSLACVCVPVWLCIEGMTYRQEERRGQDASI